MIIRELSILVSIFCIVCSFKAENSSKFKDDVYIIKGKVHGLKPFSDIYLVHRNHNDGNVDTVSEYISKNGEFQFKGRVERPGQLYTLVFVEDQNEEFVTKTYRVPIVLENKPIFIVAKIQNLEGVEIVGSQATKDYNEYIRKFRPIYLELESMAEEINCIIRESGKLITPKDSITLKEFSKRESLLRKLKDKREKEYLEELLTYIQNHRDWLYVPSCILQMEDYLGLKGMSELYDTLSENVKSSFYGFKLFIRISNLIAREEAFSQNNVGIEIGNIVPNFQAVDLNGNTVEIHTIINQGKFTLIDFWASWCKPCREDFNYLKGLVEKYKDSGFKVVGISSEKSFIDFKTAATEDALPWINISDYKNGSSLSNVLYSIYKLPTSYLVDSSGRIIAIDLRRDELGERILKLVGLRELNVPRCP